VFAGKKSAQIREILISESAWEEMTCLFAPSLSTYTSPATIPGNYPRPLRNGEETTSLWIAPYVDADDVYHQPATVLFVVKPSAWGQPRLN
ncbi:type IV conjugative transfer system lipoprotein TraV, partial [Klebsiella pneumoniae]|uniref:type IV conjugative transfer system lipoprotein TraV n=1 Tax=Klebsiella pneumoniae TaxID=573 RepID=UPI001D172F53